MKTLFVVPEIRLDSKPTIVPFWAGILASIVESKNGEVAILDLNALRMKFGGKQVPSQVIIDEISSDLVTSNDDGFDNAVWTMQGHQKKNPPQKQKNNVSKLHPKGILRNY